MDTRLVTITRPGGTGKTRPAVECGNRLLEAFGGAIVDSLRIPRSPIRWIRPWKR